MCLFTFKPAKIAKKPIKVYKVMFDKSTLLKKRYATPCQCIMVTVGDTLKAAERIKPRKCDGTFRVEGEGVHAYITMEAAKKGIYTYDVITEWEIPAGAKYWIGDGYLSTNEIAATEMKFIKVCKD